MSGGERGHVHDASCTHGPAQGAAEGAARVERLSLAQRLTLAPLALYRRFLSPLKPVPSCRFHPTCSSYAVDAVRVHGVLRGLWLAGARVLRCHPWHPGGFDPVPPPRRGAHRVVDARLEGAPHPTGAATEEP
ncbi:MAG: membrane protein insertion efficiency factor YidD [Trueperaceae bacterium]|nr:MAG: membrane protein insertion efficiency factor YidD [Trueperaceae bacterium]